MKQPEPPPLTAEDICWLLRARFKRPEYAIAFEVGNATGDDATRYADVIVMNCFPSRGLSLHGIEIKITREDLRREIREPRKAEPIAVYCDTWSVAVPKSLNLTGLEIPSNWGLYECQPDNIALVRSPMRMEPKPLDRAFTAALLRADGIERDYISQKLISEKVTELEAGINRRIEMIVAAKAAELDEKSRWVKRLLADLEVAGIHWSQLRWHEREFFEAIKFALSPKKLSHKLIQAAIESLEKCVTELRDCAEMKLAE